MKAALKKKIKWYRRLFSGKIPTIEFVHWSPGDQENFGDYLSLVILRKLVELGGGDSNEKLSIFDLNKKPKRLLAVGSILHMAKPGDVIWGTGINGKVPPRTYNFPEVDIRMVRGPLTRNILLRSGISCPEIYGDPALLLPLLFPELHQEKFRYEYTVIPNFNDMWMFNIEDENVISPLEEWTTVVKRILQSRLVISSSLHGLIIADAFGIPARIILSNHEPLFKYRDYLLSTNRSNIHFARNIDEALKMGGMRKPEIDYKPMVESFPTDLWDGKLNREMILNIIR
jgi:pyruvyltransferase